MAQLGAEPQTEGTEAAHARRNAERLAQLRSRVLLPMENRGKRSRRREGTGTEPSASVTDRQAAAHRSHAVLGPQPKPYPVDEAPRGGTGGEAARSATVREASSGGAAGPPTQSELAEKAQTTGRGIRRGQRHVRAVPQEAEWRRRIDRNRL